MNSIYIGVGLTIIAALVAALIGPFFVDWSTHRAIFEREIARMAGVEARILGDVDMRLLPSPRLVFGDVVIGPVDTPLVRVGRFEVDLEVAPLIRGEVKVAETHLERPAIDVEIDEAGRVVWPESRGTGAPSTISFELLEITDGRIAVADKRTGGRFEIGRIAATGTAASLAGPWKFDGGATAGGRQLSFRLSAGRTEGGFGLKLSTNAADDPATALLDAVIKTNDGTPSLAGSLSIEGKDPRPTVPAALGGGIFRLDTKIVATFAGVQASEATLSLGPDERVQQLTGEAQIGFGGDRRWEARLTARQLDLDRLAAADERGRAGPAAVTADLVGALTRAGDGIGAGRLSIDLGGVVLGGGVVQEFSTSVAKGPAGVAIERFETRLPGRARIDLSGKIAGGAAPGFAGRVDLSAEQPALTAAWWRGRPVSGERFDAVSLAGEVSLAADRIAGEDLSLAIGSAKARGRFDWRRDRDLTVAASAERLEFDQIARLGRIVFDGDARPPSLTVDLDAGTMVVGGISAKTVGIRARISDETLSIDRLTVADLAGAKISGSGRVDRPTTVPDGALDLAIAATRPEAVVRAIGPLLLEPATVERTAGIAALAGPLDLKLKLSGRATGGQASDVAFSAAGTAAGSVLALDGKWLGRIDDPTRAKIALKGTLDGAAPTGALARALGPFAAKGPIAVNLAADGVAAGDGLTVDASATLGGGRIAASGKIAVADDAVRIADGRLAIASPDATGFAALAGRPLVAIERRLPVDLAATVSGIWPKLDVGSLAGTIDAAKVRAGGSVDLGRRPVAVAGKVEVDRLDGATLAGLVLGSGATNEAASGWSNAALDDPAFAGVADLDLGVTVGRAMLGETLGLDRLGFRLDARGNRVRLGDASAGLAGGKIDGDVTLERDPKIGVRLEGRGRASGLALEDIGWRIAGRPVASGRIGGEAAVSTTGRSVAATVAGLSGQGRLRLDGLGIDGFGIEAMAATAVAADSGAATTPGEVDRVFAARMAASRTTIASVEVPFTIEAGVARSGRLIVEIPNARITGRGAIDLAKATIDADWSLEPTAKAAEATQTPISKATPSAGVGIRGPLDTPELRWDTRPLGAWLTLRTFEKEIERVEQLQQDQMERQRFARERRRLEEIRREQEAAKKQQELDAAKKAQDAADAAKAAAEAAKRAEDDARRNAATPAPTPAPTSTPAPVPAPVPSPVQPPAAVTPPAARAPAVAPAPPPLPPPVAIPPAPPVLSAPLTILPPTAPAQ